jgi:AcrR family transcriptional regulator
MEDVAALAGVSKGTLYNFFKSKQELFLASMIASYEDTLRLFDPEMDLESLDPRIRLEADLRVMASLLDTVSSEMTVHYQCWGIVAGDDEARSRLYDFLTRFYRDRSREMTELIEEGQRRGVFRKDVNAASITDTLLALLNGFLYRATFDPDYATAEKLAATCEPLLRGTLYANEAAAAGEGRDA